MMTQSYIRYLLSDMVSLTRYFRYQECVSVKDVKRNLMMIERENNIYIPDHHYRLGQEMSFKGITEMSELFTVGLKRLVDEYLESRDDKVYVKAERQNEWQMLLPYIPPLLLVSVKIADEHPFVDISMPDYLCRYICPNIMYSAMPSPYIPHMEKMRADNLGLHDMHIHLNGTLETDITWQDYMSNPDKIYGNLKSSLCEEKVKEQYIESSSEISCDEFKMLLHFARTLRVWLYGYVVLKQDLKQILKWDLEWDMERDIGSIKECLEILPNAKSKNYFRHPMENDFFDTYDAAGNALGRKYNLLCLESLLYIKIFQYMQRNPEEELPAVLFHYYLLILGLANKMLVQQTPHFGFEEFQKYTMNGFRAFSEAEYSRRFFQLSGNMLKNIRLVEGRFSPKDSVSGDEELISHILKKWEKLNEEQRNLGITEPSRLMLTAHFIKEKDSHPDENIRHCKLRKKVMKKAEALKELHNANNNYSARVTGIDAAASEFDTPPEVFAQAYKSLRECGYKHFTYHAGEDFFHILSGLRAIYEAIKFLGLRRGDRIGHASASGVSAGVWRNNIGDEMLIRKGEHLDNLVFAYYLIGKYGNERLKSKLPTLALEIHKWAYDVYEKHVSLNILIQSWLLRGDNPQEAINKTQKNDAEELFVKYHSRPVRERYDEIICIPTFGTFSEEELTEMQWLLLEYMHRKEIVIETLPTSNVIIGVHRSYDTYHLYNWLTWRKAGKAIPPIVVGTDDAGIFATNIYNEYCNIFCMLMYRYKMNAYDIVQFLNELDYNSKLYEFGTA